MQAKLENLVTKIVQTEPTELIAVLIAPAQTIYHVTLYLGYVCVRLARQELPAIKIVDVRTMQAVIH